MDWIVSILVVYMFLLFYDPKGKYTIDDLVDERKNIKDESKDKTNYLQNDLYLKMWKNEKKDPLKFVPIVSVKRFHKSGNEWLYGWTIRGSGIVNQRDDLEERDYRLTNYIHEAIHTPDEYETRKLTEWIMKTIEPVNEKYKNKPEEYDI